MAEISANEYTYPIYTGPHFMCSYCHTMFISEEFLNKHQKKCIHKKLHLILRIKFQLRTNTSTDDDTVNQTNKETTEDYFCEKCFCGFLTLSDYERHIQEPHSGDVFFPSHMSDGNYNEFLNDLNNKYLEGNSGPVVKFCMDMGLINKRYLCPMCGRDMELRPRPNNGDGYEFVCISYDKNNAHLISRSIRAGSWFSNSKLPISQILLVINSIARERLTSDITKELGVSSITLAEWRQFFRETCAEIVMGQEIKIGGADEIVEIYRMRIGKRKHNWGKHVERSWVYIGVEWGSGKGFLRVVQRRDRHTLLNIIKECIKPITIIYSDLWTSNCLKDEGYKDLSVNHSMQFKNPEDGIEGGWARMKRSLPSGRVKGQLDSYLGEYLWRKNNCEEKCLMGKYLEDIVQVHKPLNHDE